MYAEVIAYDRQLTATELQDVEDYLYGKWFTADQETEGEWAHTTTTTDTGLGDWSHTAATTDDGWRRAVGPPPSQPEIGNWAHTAATTDDGLGAWAHTTETTLPAPSTETLPAENITFTGATLRGRLTS